ncbi:hypothetical protein PVK06_036855 [Gossypium arboreum]|uniref:(+)-delta-cadinene synthase n=1 Tax=Gossypium arboreum TaxID=29729 RepID=A0ABR0NN52_GOSAR|nr:hypothetical protein PVK06_036855 [Gossypium arboreum]
MVIHNRGFSYDGAGDGGSQRLKYIFYSFRALGLLSRRYKFSMKSSKCVGSAVGFIQPRCSVYNIGECSCDRRFNTLLELLLQSKGDFDIFILTNQTSSHKVSGVNVKGVKMAVIDVRKADEEAESRGNKRGTTTDKIFVEDNIIVRRSANYHPPIWDYDYVQSFKNDFVQNESYKERASKLKEEVRMMFENVVDPLEKLELIDAIQRLGLSYHFGAEIKKTLKNISTDCSSTVAWNKGNLYATALEFRLLRQHGYKVNQDVFACSMDDVGNIKASLNQDCKGLLNLYEASYYLLEGETMLENARELAAKLLKQCLKENNDHHYLWMLAEHALELPLHWRMPRRWKELGLGERLSFARDRLMENFFWSVGMIITPQDGKGRRIQTKVNALITVIDDVYDVYGTLDELELFTDAVERWDINAIQKLPNYMKICYHAVYNSVNEMAFDTLKEHGIDVVPFLRKVVFNQFLRLFYFSL